MPSAFEGSMPIGPMVGIDRSELAVVQFGPKAQRRRAGSCLLAERLIRCHRLSASTAVALSVRADALARRCGGLRAGHLRRAIGVSVGSVATSAGDHQVLCPPPCRLGGNRKMSEPPAVWTLPGAVWECGRRTGARPTGSVKSGQPPCRHNSWRRTALRTPPPLLRLSRSRRRPPCQRTRCQPTPVIFVRTRSAKRVAGGLGWRWCSPWWS